MAGSSRTFTPGCRVVLGEAQAPRTCAFLCAVAAPWRHSGHQHQRSTGWKTESGPNRGASAGRGRAGISTPSRALMPAWLGRPSCTLRDAFPRSTLCSPNIHGYPPGVRVPSASPPCPTLALLPEMPSQTHPTVVPGEDSAPGSWAQGPQAQACLSLETSVGPFTSLSFPASVSASVEWE